MPGRILNVPFRSQFGLDGFLGYEDSGTACVAMLMASLGQKASVADLQQVKRRHGIQLVGGNEAARLLRACHVQVSAHRGYTLEELKYLIDLGRPAIVRIKYDRILYRWNKSLTGEHFVVVTGYDDDNDRIIINDPAYPYDPTGYQRPYSSKVFMNAWTGFNTGGQANNSLIVPHLVNPVGSGQIQANTVPLRCVTSSKDMWVTTPSGLALYDAASLKALQIGHLMFGQKITALGPTTAPSDTGHVWQIVETELGVVGVVLAASGQDDHLAGNAPSSPYLIEVQDTPAVRAVQGLALRSGCDISLPPLGRVEISERLAVYSRHEEPDGEIWLAVQSPHLEFGWVREKIADIALVKKVSFECTNRVEPLPDSLAMNWSLRTPCVKEPQAIFVA